MGRFLLYLFDPYRAQKYYQDKVLELQEQNQAFVHKIKKLQGRLREWNCYNYENKSFQELNKVTQQDIQYKTGEEPIKPSQSFASTTYTKVGVKDKRRMSKNYQTKPDGCRVSKMPSRVNISRTLDR